MKNGNLAKYLETRNSAEIVQVSVGNDSKLYGLFNIKTGKMVRDYEFTYMSDFAYGFAVIADMKKRYGVIRSDGSFFIEPSQQYGYISIDEYGVIALELDGRYELIFTKQDMDSYPLKVRDFDIVFKGDDFSILEVKIDSGTNKDTTGLITSKGYWLIDPVYEKVTVFETERMILIESSLAEGTLINLDNFEVILQEKNIRNVLSSVFCYLESGKLVFAIIEDGSVKQTTSGYDTYSVYSSSILKFFKEKDSTVCDVFSVSEKYFILKNVDSFSDLYDYEGERIPGYYIFCVDERWGIVSSKGEILLQAAMDKITPVEKIPALFKITVNGKTGIWNYISKAWVLFPQFNETIFDNFGCFRVSSIETVGRFNRYRKVWRYVNINGESIFDEAFLEAGEVEENARAKVKRLNGKYMYISFS